MYTTCWKDQHSRSWDVPAIALYENGFLTGNGDEIQELLDQAKEMEREQIENAFSIGEVMATDYFYGEDNCAINYYNETYGGNK
jgi:hypothetical protein